MTQAVCFNCGEIKFGAYLVCDKCGKTPHTDDELILSLAMSDHYFKIDDLLQIGRDVKNGTPPQLDEATRKKLLASVPQIRKMTGISANSLAPTIPVKKKSKWWPF